MGVAAKAHREWPRIDESGLWAKDTVHSGPRLCSEEARSVLPSPAA